jgi:tRNA A-37 threonylcarbamoyl transferase component Bud32
MTPIGATLAGKYEIKRLLGRGGMGAVYEAEHIEIGKRVAIKLLGRDAARSEETAERFRREARAAARIESEHIVAVSDVGDDPTFGLYMVMQLLVGEDLAQRLARERRLPARDAVEIAHQIARGLAKAHEAGVVHRDLKPANIFLTRRDDGRTLVKIVDFGVSKLMSSSIAEDRKVLTRHGVTMGTPQYMAPEQVQGGVVWVGTDVWAAGALLYEMLAGRPAFERQETYEQTVLAIVLQRPPPLASLASATPAAVVAVVDAALEHDVKKRIQSCDELADRLAAALPEAFPLSQPSVARAVAITRVTTPTSAIVAAEGAPPRAAARWVVVGVLVVAAVIAGVGFGRWRNARLAAERSAREAEVRGSEGARPPEESGPRVLASTSAATEASGANASASVASSTTPTDASASSARIAGVLPSAPPSTGSGKPLIASMGRASASASAGPSVEPSAESEFGGVGVSSSY